MKQTKQSTLIAVVAASFALPEFAQIPASVSTLGEQRLNTVSIIDDRTES
jgi:hypothetical protein